MRENIFKQNYELLLKLASEIMSDTIPDFYLERKPAPVSNIIKFGTFARRIDNNHIDVGSFYYWSNGGYADEGEPVTDPAMVILFNSELGTARITRFFTNNPSTVMLNGGREIDTKFDCTENSAETDEEKELNNYLNEWLKAIVEDKETIENYFKKVALENFEL